MKASLILKNKLDATSLVDLGCGWGSIPQRISSSFDRIIGVDESEERLNVAGKSTPDLKTIHANIASLPLESNCYDIALLCHVFHELLLFSSEDTFQNSITEIKRILKKNTGRLFIIDHRDPGSKDKKVKIEVSDEILIIFKAFVDKFEYRPVQDFKIKGNCIELLQCDCHDFVTKIWAMNSGAENLEMNETHCIVDPNEVKQTLSKFNLKVDNVESFNPISDLMKFYGIRLVQSSDWDRQIFMTVNLS